MLGLAAISQPLTTTLIGQQWLYTSRLLRILCVYFMFFPLNSINYMILEINGNGNRYLKLQISNVVIGIIILCCTIPFGLSAVCIGLVASVSLSYIINASLCGGSIGLGLRSQLKAISPIVINATIMALIVYSLQFLITEAWIQIMLGLITGVIVYGGLSLVFQTSLCKTATSLFK